MTADRPRSDNTTLADRRAQIDRICDHYEAAWRAGHSLSIAEIVADVEGALRAVLEAEINALAEELDRERSTGERGHEDFPVDRATLLRAIIDCPTFSFLPPSSAMALAERLEHRRVSVGTPLLVQAEPCPGLQIVLRGRLTIELKDAAGVKHHIDEALPGSIVGEMGLLTGRPCTASVWALEETDVLTLPTAAFTELQKQFPELELALAQLVGDRLGERAIDGLCGKVVGPCRLLRCLGRGGMGVVYDAQMIDDESVVAVKMLRHSLADDTHAADQFHREAAVLSNLRHEGIARVRNLFVDCRTLFFIMERCDGLNLQRLLGDYGPVPPPTARKLLGQLASALSHAHKRDIVHLDLKPSNVIVTGDGCTKLIDFGLARILAEDQAGCWSGTPRYMAPEQLAEGTAGPAADWYAWGCLAVELLTARPLFDSSNLIAMATAKAAWPPPQMGDWSASDPELAEIVEASLHPLPELRELDLEAVSRWAEPAPEIFHR
jgi:tRNA A-37 threonylcarbamoyl transferase component Bud32